MAAAKGAGAHRIGAIAERFESGGRGPGTVSSGAGDPGGISYGTYQLASRTGTLGRFLSAEGARWAAELATGGKPGSAGFSAVWKAIARRDRAAFGAAQHGFIARTHYAPAIRRHARGCQCSRSSWRRRLEKGCGRMAGADIHPGRCWRCDSRHRVSSVSFRIDFGTCGTGTDCGGLSVTKGAVLDSAQNCGGNATPADNCCLAPQPLSR